jgi:predicted dehydrogenase
MGEVHLITLDPGHFHAALVQKQMLPGIAPQVQIYAPLGPDLLAHLGRIAGFNGRADDPTRWELEVHACADFLERFVAEEPGNVAVLSGRNNVKIDYLEAAVNAGLHVLADKPCIIRAVDFPRLEAVLAAAKCQGLIVHDMMTERCEITTILQKELINDREVFGDILPGSAAEPGVVLKSVHCLKKSVAGTPLRRPPWFFDIAVEGEGLTDVGTHLVDLAMWMLFPGKLIRPVHDLHIYQAGRWPLFLSKGEFQSVTGESDFPSYLCGHVHEGKLAYYCNTALRFALCGIAVDLTITWDFEAGPAGGDSHLAIFRGSQATIEVRQGEEQDYRPELDVIPTGLSKAAILGALRRKVAALEISYPGLALDDQGDRFWLRIPDRYRAGHEAHFAEVAGQFLAYLRAPATVPTWETANLLAKYWLTTHGVSRAH